jgi:hypothetical protein
MRIILEIVQLLTKPLRSAIDLAKDFTNQRAGQVIPRMMRQRRRTPIGVSVKYMASFLSHHSESKSKQDLFHPLAIDDGKPAHPGTSICWSPINRGRSSPAFWYSSRHNSRTSFRFFCNSSKLLPCVCAPGIPGTKPTYSLVSGSHSKYAVNVFMQHLHLCKCLYRLLHDSRSHQNCGEERGSELLRHWEVLSSELAVGGECGMS